MRELDAQWRTTSDNANYAHFVAQFAAETLSPVGGTAGKLMRRRSGPAVVWPCKKQQHAEDKSAASMRQSFATQGGCADRHSQRYNRFL